MIYALCLHILPVFLLFTIDDGKTHENISQEIMLSDALPLRYGYVLVLSVEGAKVLEDWKPTLECYEKRTIEVQLLVLKTLKGALMEPSKDGKHLVRIEQFRNCSIGLDPPSYWMNREVVPGQTLLFFANDETGNIEKMFLNPGYMEEIDKENTTLRDVEFILGASKENIPNQIQRLTLLLKGKERDVSWIIAPYLAALLSISDPSRDVDLYHIVDDIANLRMSERGKAFLLSKLIFRLTTSTKENSLFVQTCAKATIRFLAIAHTTGGDLTHSPVRGVLANQIPKLLALNARTPLFSDLFERTEKNHVVDGVKQLRLKKGLHDTEMVSLEAIIKVLSE